MKHSAAEPSSQAARRDRDTCLAKLTWATREQAAAAAAYAVWQYGEVGQRPQPYRCRSCGQWHLARAD
jgi:hypothetical protein